MNHLLTLLPIASTDGFRDGLWIGLMSAIAILLVVKLFRQNAATAPASAPTASSPASPLPPRIIVNIPPDLKAIAALPGDTSIEGQRALLWYNVYKEAIKGFSSDGDSYLSFSENNSAVEAANEAVKACYGGVQS